MTAADRRIRTWLGIVAIVPLVVAVPAPATAEPDHAFHHYVFDSMRFGTTANEADSYAFNLDDDPYQSPDNVIGHVFAGLSAQLNVDGALAAALNAGDAVVLSALRAHNLTADTFASWQVYAGTPQPHPDLSGGGHFSIDPTAAQGTEMLGAVAHGQFAGGPGAAAVRLGIVPGQAPIELHLIDTHVQARCDANGCSNGKLGGAVPAMEATTVLIPALASLMQTIVVASCPGPIPASCSPTAVQLLSLFDADRDGSITVAEVQANALIQAVFAPDQDLLNANGSAGHDGVRESLSIGLGFTAKAAVFSVPGERYPRPTDFPRNASALMATVAEDFIAGGSVSGIGNAQGLGRVLLHSTGDGGFAPCNAQTGWEFSNYPPTIFFSAGVALDAARGDRLCIDYVLTFTDTASPAQGLDFSLAGTFAIRGGTGRFAGVTGGGTIAGVCTSYTNEPVLNCRDAWTGLITTP